MTLAVARANDLYVFNFSIQVQCSNIHFHAHSDGSTTIHQHRTCKRRGSHDNGNEDVDLDLEMEQSHHHQEFLLRAARMGETDGKGPLEDFPQHVERERYLGVRINYLFADIYAP